MRWGKLGRESGAGQPDAQGYGGVSVRRGGEAPVSGADPSADRLARALLCPMFHNPFSKALPPHLFALARGSCFSLGLVNDSSLPSLSPYLLLSSLLSILTALGRTSPLISVQLHHPFSQAHPMHLASQYTAFSPCSPNPCSSFMGKTAPCPPPDSRDQEWEAIYFSLPILTSFVAWTHLRIMFLNT